LCGRTFARYAASGTEITVVCALAPDGSSELRQAARRLGVKDLVLLDYRPEELASPALEDVFADVMASVRPHVVVADGTRSAVRDATAVAFSRTRRTAGGSAALPAKLYYRPPAGEPAIAITTAIALTAPSGPEHFVRAFPNPWVTGVLERDLFAGLSAARESGLEERLAS
jgi:LmbE family N-acetylglucosaminyl deacetylase